MPVAGRHAPDALRLSAPRGELRADATKLKRKAPKRRLIKEYGTNGSALFNRQAWSQSDPKPSLTPDAVRYLRQNPWLEIVPILIVARVESRWPSLCDRDRRLWQGIARRGVVS